MHELEGDKDSLASDPDNLKVIFKEMIQMCLWYGRSVWGVTCISLTETFQGECHRM